LFVINDPNLLKMLTRAINTSRNFAKYIQVETYIQYTLIGLFRQIPLLLLKNCGLGRNEFFNNNCFFFAVQDRNFSLRQQFA